jgi:hypothetical protein
MVVVFSQTKMMEDQTDLSQFRSPEKYKKIKPSRSGGEGKRENAGCENFENIKNDLCFVRGRCGKGTRVKRNLTPKTRKCGFRESATFLCYVTMKPSFNGEFVADNWRSVRMEYSPGQERRREGPLFGLKVRNGRLPRRGLGLYFHDKPEGLPSFAARA